MKKILNIFLKILGVLGLAFLLLVEVTEISPVYKFRAPHAFAGPAIYNPYASLDTLQGWKKANFHTHTRVKGPWPPNEGDTWPLETFQAYERLGYQIVTFSNHNEITTHPFDPALQVNVYEQGYSPYKFHKLVFGSKGVRHLDPFLPVLASQKQFELERLDAQSDFIQINHPYRTWGMSKSHMEKLSGYEIMELDTNIGTENEYWDWALSAGHFSFGLANDDLHHPGRTECIGIRCNFIQTPSGRYEDLREALLGGCYYSMRVPDYGHGDWEEKIRRSRMLPSVKDIGLRGDTLYIRLSQAADTIRVNGQDHAVLAKVHGQSELTYVLGADEPYARFTAFFPGGEVLYSNPFARYDPSSGAGLFDKEPQKVNVFLTLLWNLFILVLMVGTVWLGIKMFRK